MYSTLELLILPFRDLSFYLKRFFPHQVNSNVVYHSTDQYGQSKIVRVDTTYVGKKIYTKAVGLNMFEDITLTYKNQEGEFKQCSGGFSLKFLVGQFCMTSPSQK